MKNVVIAGAGFSGLVSAYFMAKAGYNVRVVEKSDKPGGLIHSVQTPWGLCETAANGIMNSGILERLALDVGVELTPSRSESRKRYIFRERPRRWPLTVAETANMAARFTSSRSRKPKSGEALYDWAARVLGQAGADYLVGPAFTGIYAGDARCLSATLVLRSLFKRKKKQKVSVRGLVSPRDGMQELILGLEKYLLRNGVKFEYGAHFHLNSIDHDEIQIIATNASAAAEILKESAPDFSNRLSKVDLLPIVRVTVFYPRHSAKLHGFGVLFPRDQEVRALGVLFDNFVFENRSEHLEESWILGGATDRGVLNLADEEILEAVYRDREILYGTHDLPAPLGHRIQRWPRGFPHFSVELENLMNDSRRDLSGLAERGIYLIGNYTHSLGLSQILEVASNFPALIESRPDLELP